MEMKYLNGTYTGECENSIPNGYGVYTAEDGSVYKGSWVNGELINGVLHAGEKVYIGEFKKMLPHGKGTEYVSRFRKFTGRFNKGRKTKPQKGWGCYNAIQSGIKDPMRLSRKESEKLTKDLEHYSDSYGVYTRLFPLETISEAVGFGVLCLNDGYKQAYGYSGNGIASKLIGKDITGNIIICRDDGNGTPIPFSSPEETEQVYDAVWKELFEPYYCKLYHYVNAVKIAVMAQCRSIFLIGTKLYAVDHTGCENNVSDYYEGWESSRPCVSVRVHLLPDGMADPAEAKIYVDEHNAWSEWLEKDRECNEADTARRAGNELFEQCIHQLTTEQIQ